MPHYAETGGFAKAKPLFFFGSLVERRGTRGARGSGARRRAQSAKRKAQSAKRRATGAERRTQNEGRAERSRGARTHVGAWSGPICDARGSRAAYLPRRACSHAVRRGSVRGTRRGGSVFGVLTRATAIVFANFDRDAFRPSRRSLAPQRKARSLARTTTVNTLNRAARSKRNRPLNDPRRAERIVRSLTDHAWAPIAIANMRPRAIAPQTTALHANARNRPPMHGRPAICTVRSVPCPLHTSHFANALRTSPRALRPAHCALPPAPYALRTAHFPLLRAPRAEPARSAPCSVRRAQCPVRTPRSAFFSFTPPLTSAKLQTTLPCPCPPRMLRRQP
jgi:hypothetical protein